MTATIGSRVQPGDIVQTSRHSGQIKVNGFDEKRRRLVGVAIKEDGHVGKARRVFDSSEVTHLWPQLDCGA
jgi:hypothetical protein